MKKAVLKDKTSEYFENLIIYAISSTETDLRICMILNSVLGINLTLAEDCVISVHDQNIRFRKYSFEAEEVEEKIQLFVNKNNGYYLFNELKKIDYFLLIQTEANIAGLEKALQNLKNTPGISVLSKLDPGSLRSLSKII